MKKIFIILLVIVIFSACKKTSFLDDKTNNALNETTVFADSVLTMSFLTRIYEDEGFAFAKIRGGWENGGQEQATDDSEFSLQNGARRPNILIQSSYNADNFPGFTEIYQTPWDNIRRVNLLLSELPNTPLAAATRTRVGAEARFLRAWYYYNLLINIGGVPLIGDKVYGASDFITIGRSTFSESVSYIANELDAVTAILPVNYVGNDYGRVTKGAAMALKARLLLFAASPLFNGNTWPQPSTPESIALAGYPDYKVERWQAAADAANAVIKSGTYSLVVDNSKPGLGFYSMFLQRINSEYIFYHNRGFNKDFESFYLPTSRSGNHYGTPTQNLVDCFPMKDGKAITDPTSAYAYNPQNPYINRDPRFRYSVIYNGAPYFNQSTGAFDKVFTYVGAPSDGFVYNSSTNGPSGYYARKMCDSTLANNSPGNTTRGWPLIRYADILLSYAEAINETGQTSLAYAPLVQIRARAGIDAGANGLYGMKANMTVIEMRAFIQNERHIELMYENTRWDDVRRWKIAMVTNNGYHNIMKVTKDPVSGNFTYQVVPSLWLHTFTEKNYILPIPTSEIRKDPALIQNPGW